MGEAKNRGTYEQRRANPKRTPKSVKVKGRRIYRPIIDSGHAYFIGAVYKIIRGGSFVRVGP